MASRQYEMIVFGASGYTGQLTAEHITQTFPTDLKWALAGRSASKLEAIAAELKILNPDRIQPGIEICPLTDEGLSELAKKTAVLIAAVGPYALYGEHAFKACAETGTHYLDVTGEVPWVAKMIKKYENTAKSSGAIMISQIGIESAPPDLITFALVNMIKERFSAPTGEVVVSQLLKAAPSGGTLASVLAFLDVFSLKEIKASLTPYAMSSIPGPKTRDPASWVTKLLGIRSVRDLGILTTSLAGKADAAIVHRSWGFLGYGPNFHFTEYAKTRNYLTGIAFHFALMLGAALLALPPFRKLIRRFVYQPGQGPTREQYKNDRFEFRAVATPDTATPTPVRAFYSATWQGSMYAFTGVCLAEAAISILRDRHELSGGVYTPASLGQKFIDRLEGAGMKVEKKFFEH